MICHAMLLRMLCPRKTMAKKSFSCGPVRNARTASQSISSGF